jgi:cellulose synthase/poly-beta-1,6-N-acetylglucosamine synthase-like glycosyltransferase
MPDRSNMQATVDVVIPVYGERSEALEATLSACVKQSHPIAKIFVVDDGSPGPVLLPEWAQSSARIVLLRLPQNQGAAAARNAAIALSNATLLACVDTEVLPDPDWLDTCMNHLSSNPGVGACATRVVPARPDRILTRWRMRFQEPKYPQQSGPTLFAHGHAVMFRREAVQAVGGYDASRRTGEDWDICQRMRRAGWESHFIASSRCVSIQQDSLSELARKQLRDSGWRSPAESSLVHLYYHLSKWTLVRASRNLVKGRIYFLPVDAAIWASALWTATLRTLGELRRTSLGV